MEGLGIRVSTACAAVQPCCPTTTRIGTKPTPLHCSFGGKAPLDTIARYNAPATPAPHSSRVVGGRRPAGCETELFRRVTSHVGPTATLVHEQQLAALAVPCLMKNPGYDPVKDFAAITRMRKLHAELCIHPGIRAEVGQELSIYAKANKASCRSPAAKTPPASCGRGRFTHWAEIRK